MLTEPTQALLAFASVIGAEFSLSLLQAATGERAAQDSRIKEAVSAEMLSPISGDVTRQRFAHVLIRESIYQDLPVAQRQAVHLRIAELLRGQAGSEPGRFLDELAFHYYRSLPGSPARAFHFSLLAARAAQSVAADAHACALYERALEAWDFQTEVERDHVQRCRALLGLARCSLTTDRGPAARLLVVDAIRLARGIGRPDLLAFAVALANVYSLAGHPTTESLREVTEEALNLLPEGLPSVKGYLLSCVASDATVPIERRRALAVQTMHVLTSPEEGEEAAFLDDQLRLDLPILRAEAIRFCLSSLGPDDLGLCLQLTTRATRLAEQGDLRSAWVVHRCRARAHLILGDIAAADEDIRRADELADRLREPIVDFEGMTLRGYRAQMAGRFEEAQREIDSAATATWPIEPSHRDFLRQVRTIVLKAGQGIVSPAEVDQHFLELLPSHLIRVYQFPKSAADAIACMMISYVNRELAKGMFDAMAERGFDAVPKDDFYLVTLCDLAVTCCGLADRPRAADLYQRLDPYGSLCAVEIPLHFRGPVAHVLGMLARVLGDDASAVGHFETAAAISARVGAHPMLNRARAELADVLLSRQDATSRARVDFLVQEGLASARELAMVDLCTTFEDLAARFRERCGPTGSASAPERRTR
jgi:hypothetical protein